MPSQLKMASSSADKHRWRKKLQRLIRPAWMGTLNRTRPLSERWGIDRGTPVDRFYVERFLLEHGADIRGRVLEVRDSQYTLRFGTGVTRTDVLDIDESNANASLIADLAHADSIPSDSFDCFVLTQTLQFIYDLASAVSHIHRILRPGGVLLLTVPGISRIDGALRDVDYWRFSIPSCNRLLGYIFGEKNVAIRSYGNVQTAIAFLTGMAREELSEQTMELSDPLYPVIIAARAVKTRENR